MKLIIFVCLLCLATEVKAQYEPVQEITFSYKDWFLSEANEYIKECSLDTIKATQFEDEFIIHKNWYTSRMLEGSIEMVTEKQLEDRGYKYRYRWVTNPEALKFSGATLQFEYIFIREPTFKGFIEWWEKKK